MYPCLDISLSTYSRHNRDRVSVCIFAFSSDFFLLFHLSLFILPVFQLNISAKKEHRTKQENKIH